MNRILFVSVCVAFVVLASRAQIPHSMTESYNARLGGTNYISGTIYWPSGRRVDRRMSIRIRPQTAGEITMSTDTNGQFIVGGLPEGYFYISVDDEPDFEPVNVMVEILLSREQPKPTYTVNIRLKDKLKLQPKPLVVDARVASAPKRAAEAYNRSQELSRKGDHAGAVELLKIAVAEFPAFAEAYNELGVQYMRLNELDKAEAALKDALKTKPDAFEPLLNLGIVLFRLKRTEAEESLRKAVAANQQSPLPHYYLGRLLTAAEKYEEAERELKAAVQFGGSEMKEAHRMLANLYISSGNDARAVEELETYLKLAPDAPDALKLRETIIILKTPKQPAPNTKP